MKKFLALLFSVVVICSCKKDSSDPSKSSGTGSPASSLLSSHYWRLGYQATADFNSTGQIGSTSYDYPDSCTGDNHYNFDTDGFLRLYVNVITCGAHNDSFPWAFEHSNSGIAVNVDGTTSHYTIVHLNYGKLLIANSDYPSPGHMTTDTAMFCYP